MEKRIKFKMVYPKEINLIHKIFKEANFDLFLVGGCVRDAFLKIKPKDFDLVTNAVPDKVIELLKDQPFVSNILETGKAFGVINVIANGEEFEIATMREDSLTGDGRRPDSVTFTDIYTDVLRRDLTCNALFFDLDTSELVDLVGGLEDLKKGIVRTVGNAEDRFNEDRLRILRAIRFASRFRCNLDKDITNALMYNNSLKGISGERIHDEFVKGIKSAKVSGQYLSVINRFELFEWIFPKLNLCPRFHSIVDEDPIVVISILLMQNDFSQLGRQLNELKFSKDDVNSIIFLGSLMHFESRDIVFFKKFQKRSIVTDEQIRKMAAFNGIDDDFIEKFLEFELTVTGEFVMEQFGIPAGSELGKKINELEVDNFRAMLNSVTF